MTGIDNLVITLIAFLEFSKYPFINVTGFLIIILAVDEQASGDQEFTIKTTYGTNKSKEQRVELSVEREGGSSTGNLDSVTEHFRKNWFIYGFL